MLHSIGMLMHPYYTYFAHQHHVWEINYYTSGSGEIVIGEAVFPFHEGDIFIQPPRVLHSETSKSGYQNIHMALKDIPQSLNDVRRLQDTSTNDIRAILMMIYRAHHWQDSPNEALSSALLDVFFQYIFLARNTTMNRYVEQMAATLIANLSNADFSLSDMYRDMHINEDYARRIFRAEMHCSPLAYLTKVRMRHACNLFRSSNGEASVREVGELVGIRDAFYFSRMFKAHTGESPKNWAKRMLEETQMTSDFKKRP